MGNRRKAKRPDLSIGDPGVSLPKDEKVLVKTVPAVIHWGQFKDVERNDSETIGQTLIFEDGTHEIFLNKDEISEEAKKVMGLYDKLHVSVHERENN